MFLHVLADTLGSVGVIFSSLLIRFFGWTWSDPLCSIFIAVLITGSTWPLLVDSGEILLQRAPRALDTVLPSALLEVRLWEKRFIEKLTNIEGVVGYSNAHFWQVCHGTYTGSIRIQAHPQAHEAEIRKRVLYHFHQMGVSDIVVQVDTDVIHM